MQLQTPAGQLGGKLLQFLLHQVSIPLLLLKAPTATHDFVPTLVLMDALNVVDDCRRVEVCPGKKTDPVPRVDLLVVVGKVVVVLMGRSEPTSL